MYSWSCPQLRPAAGRTASAARPRSPRPQPAGLRLWSVSARARSALAWAGERIASVAGNRLRGNGDGGADRRDALGAGIRGHLHGAADPRHRGRGGLPRPAAGAAALAGPRRAGAGSAGGAVARGHARLDLRDAARLAAPTLPGGRGGRRGRRGGPVDPGALAADQLAVLPLVGRARP